MSLTGVPDITTFLASLSLSLIPKTTLFPLADPSVRPLDIARIHLAAILDGIVDNCSAQTAYNAIIPPVDIYAGDFAVILPKLLGKGKSDWDVDGFELVQKFSQNSLHPLFELPLAEGVHLRVWLNLTTLFNFVMPYIEQRGINYGLPTLQSENSVKKTILEFSSPNLATPFAARHLRSTLHRMFISNVHASFHYPVHKLNYLGDWGKNLALLGVGFSRFGDPNILMGTTDAITASESGKTVQHLEEVYAKIEESFRPEVAASKRARNDKTGEEAELEGRGLFKERNDWFAALERGEKAQLEFFTRVRELYVMHYAEDYARLGLVFDSYTGESSIKVQTMEEVERLLREKGVLEEAEGGSLVVDLKKHGKDRKVKSGMCIIRDRGGSSTYLLRDLGAVLERSRLDDMEGVEKLLYVVESGQHGVHFGRVQVLLELMGLEEEAAKVQHVGFGELSGVEAITEQHTGLLDEVLRKTTEGIEKSLAENETKAAVLKKVLGEDINSEVLAANALLVQELGARRAADHTIDFQKATSFEPGTALDMIYWLGRLETVLLEDTNTNTDVEELPTETQPKSPLLDSEDQITLLRLLAQYPDVTQHSFKTLEAVGVVAYLTNVTELIAACLDLDNDGNDGETDDVDDGDGRKVATLSASEVMLYQAAKVVLENGLRFLGVRGIPTN